MANAHAPHAPVSAWPIPLLALPTCVLGVRISQDRLEEIAFLPPGTALQAAVLPLAQLFQQEIETYLSEPVYCPQLPLMPRGTVFQNRVWQSISRIPSGETRSYGEIADLLNSSPRAVGQACGANPFPLAIPCHRVIARQSLGGFARQNTEWLIRTKQWLLAHEKQR